MKRWIKAANQQKGAKNEIIWKWFALSIMQFNGKGQRIQFSSHIFYYNLCIKLKFFWALIQNREGAEDALNFEWASVYTQNRWAFEPIEFQGTLLYRSPLTAGRQVGSSTSPRLLDTTSSRIVNYPVDIDTLLPTQNLPFYYLIFLQKLFNEQIANNDSYTEKNIF